MLTWGSGSDDQTRLESLHGYGPINPAHFGSRRAAALGIFHLESYIFTMENYTCTLYFGKYLPVCLQAANLL